MSLNAKCYPLRFSNNSKYNAYNCGFVFDVRLQSIFPPSYVAWYFTIEPLVNLHAVIRHAEARVKVRQNRPSFFPNKSVSREWEGGSLSAKKSQRSSFGVAVIGRFLYKRLYTICSTALLKLMLCTKDYTKKLNVSFNNVGLHNNLAIPMCLGKILYKKIIMYFATIESAMICLFFLYAYVYVCTY